MGEKKAKPKPKPGVKRSARRQRIATAVVSGQSVNAIAHTERISRSWASAEVNSAEVRQIIASLLDSRAEAMTRLLDLSLEVIEGALQAEGHEIQNDEDGMPQLVPTGADHAMRLRAAKLYKDFATVGRPKLATAPRDTQSLPTYEQLTKVLEQAGEL